MFTLKLSKTNYKIYDIKRSYKIFGRIIRTSYLEFNNKNGNNLKQEFKLIITITYKFTILNKNHTLMWNKRKSRSRYVNILIKNTDNVIFRKNYIKIKSHIFTSTKILIPDIPVPVSFDRIV